MDKKAIKRFAVGVRNTLIASVKNKAAMIGITEDGIEEAKIIDKTLIEVPSTGSRLESNDVKKRKRLVAELENRAKHSGYKIAYETLIEEVAYTWFNRVIAIRFMEVNNYLPFRLRVLSSEKEGKQEPDIITELLDTDLYQEFDESTKNRIVQLLMDNTADAIDELYQLVFIKVCNSLNKQLPDLFETINDYTELLFTISYIDDNGIIANLMEIPEADFDINQQGQVEIIGWMYQYYNTEPKDKVFARGNRKIRSDEIPAATQLFTPDWIVRYMVENSLGRFYIDQRLANPIEERTEKEIADSFDWKYYLPTAEQPEDVQLQIQDDRKDKSIFTLQELTLIDPSMGSGHILVYAFDVFMQLYEAEGESTRNAAELILEKNLYGLDIDKRAFQLAYFALMMKARQYNRRILSKNIRPNVFEIPNGFGLTKDDLVMLPMNYPDKEKAKLDIVTLIDGFRYGKNLGSLIKFENIDFENLKTRINKDQLSFDEQNLAKLIQVGQTLQNKYTIGVTNPPYLGSSGMNKTLSDFVKKEYPRSKSDLFAVFIERLSEMIISSGYYSLITQHAWMFLSSFEKLRIKLNSQTIVNMMHLGTRAFEEIGGEVVQTTAFVISLKKFKQYVGSYLRLVDFPNAREKEMRALRAINQNGKVLYRTAQDNFVKIPGNPISYWVSENLIHDFVVGKRLGELINPRGGLTTGDNNRFLRQWFEVDYMNINFSIKNNYESSKNQQKWVPIDKGGPFKKWYGNYDFIINWENDGEEVKSEAKNRWNSVTRTIKNIPYYFQDAISFPKITSGGFSSRYREVGSIHESAGNEAFSNNHELLIYIIGITNSKVANLIFSILNPTINLQTGNFENFPVLCDKKIYQFTNGA